MKDKDFIRLEQIERLLSQYRGLIDVKPPGRGWVRAIREALGMSSPQLARRMRIKAAQSVEDMQKDELSGAIKLRTLSKLAEALDCQLVYALVPRKPLQELRRDRASVVARLQIGRVSHSMSLEEQGVSAEAEQSELNRRIDKLLYGNPKKLWD